MKPIKKLRAWKCLVKAAERARVVSKSWWKNYASDCRNKKRRRLYCFRLQLRSSSVLHNPRDDSIFQLSSGKPWYSTQSVSIFRFYICDSSFFLSVGGPVQQEREGPSAFPADLLVTRPVLLLASRAAVAGLLKEGNEWCGQNQLIGWNHRVTFVDLGQGDSGGVRGSYVRLANKLRNQLSIEIRSWRYRNPLGLISRCNVHDVNEYLR